MSDAPDRRQVIIDCLEEAFSDLMESNPRAFRTKFRKMAADPFAFYRGSACLFYADLADVEDRWADERTGRVWIHGDLHAENFGTAMNGDGDLVFDVNDFDEAYVGPFSWDLRRFVASLALLGWSKAMPESDVEELAQEYLRAYVAQVRRYTERNDDADFALRLDNTEGPLRDVLEQARASSRTAMLDEMTLVSEGERRFREKDGHRMLDDEERRTVEQAYEQYLRTVAPNQRESHRGFYRVKDVIGVSGFGIGSAGLRAYNVLIEGYDQALENDQVLSMKQGNVPAVSRVVDLPEARDYFDDEGHRTAVSQRALQVHADPFLGHTRIDGVGYIVAELSPYELDLSWDDLTEPDQIAPVVADLGRATAKIHCVSDADSDQTLVQFQTEEAIAAVIGDDETAFVDDLIGWGTGYADQVRADHGEFVTAFRSGRIGGVAATERSGPTT